MKKINVPCPFCGKSVALVGSLFEISGGEDSSAFCHDHYSVVCNYNEGGCGASTGQQHKTAESAIKAWITRTNNSDFDLQTLTESSL